MTTRKNGVVIKKRRQRFMMKVIIFALLTLVGGGFAFLSFWVPMWNLLAAGSWEKVPCTILSSQVKERSGSKGGRDYAVEIAYRYGYHGQSFCGNKYDFASWSFCGSKGARVIVEAYPSGRKTVCYVNPSSPGEAVLNPEFRADYLFGMLPLIFFIVGFLGLSVELICWYKKYPSPLIVVPGIVWRIKCVLGRNPE